MEVVEGLASVEDVDAYVDRLAAIGDEHGVAVVAFDARYVTDRAHLERAVRLATRAVSRGEAIARDRSMEILCYAAGRRQISRALEMGVVSGDGPVVVVIDAGPDPAGDAGDREAAAASAVRTTLEPAATLGEYDPPLVREYFEIGDAELAATTADLPALVRERVAMLVVEK